MAIKIRNDYLAAPGELRPNLYEFGELIKDVTTQPVTKRTVESHVRNYDAAHHPELGDIYTTTSTLTRGEDSPLDLPHAEPRRSHRNMKMKRHNHPRTVNHASRQQALPNG